MTRPGLRIADSITLPVDAVTQTIAAIGRKGAGKTYLATMLAEQMLDAGAQVIVLDPVGNFWGLRVGADGRSKGKDIFVLGGEHGDVPLTPEAGAKIGQLLVERRVSAVLDVSRFRVGERKRFAVDFAEEFFHRKKSQRTPVHLVVEEAQLFIPQRCGAGEERMLGAFEAIVRLGRNYGVGATLITQRPQSVNKEVLSQVECLCVLQVNGTHERKALEEWVQEAGADRKLVGELPGLSRGEGFVWSPSWLRKFERVHFARKTTFDASATPEVGRAARAASLSAVDVEALRSDMAEVVAAAEKDDPKKLRADVARLERELAAARSAPAKTERVEVPVLAGEDLQAIRDMADRCSRILHRLQGAPATAPAKLPPQPTPSPRPPRQRPLAESNGKLAGGERKILTALAQYPDGRTKRQVAILTGYAVNGGGFNNYLSALRTRGLIKGEREQLAITEVGLSELGDFEPLPQRRELLEYWMRQVGKAERLVLAALAAAFPNAMSKEHLGALTGYEPSGGGFNNALSRLRTLELIEGRGELRLSEELA